MDRSLSPEGNNYADTVRAAPQLDDRSMKYILLSVLALWACKPEPTKVPEISDDEVISEDCADQAVEDVICADPECWVVCDADGDGYTGTIFHGDDCDDSDPSVHPNQVDACADGIDQNCTGFDADCHPPLTEQMFSADAHIRFAGQDGVTTDLGQVTAVGHILNDEGYRDVVIDDSHISTPSNVFVYAVDSTTTVLRPADAIVQISTPEDHNLGQPHLVDDVNGDGLQELFLTANAVNDTVGAAYLIHSPLSSDSAEYQADLTITNLPGGLSYQFTSYETGDYDNDRIPELLLGNDDLLAVIAADQTGRFTLDEAARLTLLGVRFWDSDNGKVGDLNGDGIPELGHANSDGVYLFAGDSSGSLTMDDADTSVARTAQFGGFGEYLHDGPTDFDDDGTPDLLFGGTGTYLCAGPLDGDYSVVDCLYAELPVASAIHAGDLNTDGAPDIAIGSPDGQGSVMIFLGPVTGSLVPSDADMVLRGSGPTFGNSVRLTDIDRDGYDDLLIGDFEPIMTTGTGDAFLFYGGPL